MWTARRRVLVSTLVWITNTRRTHVSVPTDSLGLLVRHWSAQPPDMATKAAAIRSNSPMKRDKWKAKPAAKKALRQAKLTTAAKLAVVREGEAKSSRRLPTSCVMHVCVANLRPKWNNLKEWMEADPNHIYIGRGGPVFIDGARFPKNDSPYANCVKISKDKTREQAIRAFQEGLRAKVKAGKVDLDAYLKPFVNPNVVPGCWCAPLPCHGHFLVAIARASDAVRRHWIETGEFVY